MEVSNRVDGEALLAALNSVREFYVEVARLLRTADAWVRERRRWKSITGNQCLSELSRSLNDPDSWMPMFAARYYRADESTAAFVSVLFGRKRSDRLVTPLVEPLVYGGWVRYEGRLPKKFRARWIARVWHWMKSALYVSDERHAVARRAIHEPVRDGVHVEQGCTKPVPLVDVASIESLAQHVLEPLVASVGN